MMTTPLLRNLADILSAGGTSTDIVDLVGVIQTSSGGRGYDAFNSPYGSDLSSTVSCTCPSSTHNARFWPSTACSGRHNLPCDAGRTGSIVRDCDGSSQWMDPDTANCVSQVISVAARVVVTEENAHAIATVIDTATQSASSIGTDDVSNAMAVLQRIEELGYIGNHTAHAFVQSLSNMLDISDPVYFMGLQRTLRKTIGLNHVAVTDALLVDLVREGMEREIQHVAPNSASLCTLQFSHFRQLREYTAVAIDGINRTTVDIRCTLDVTCANRVFVDVAAALTTVFRPMQPVTVHMMAHNHIAFGRAYVAVFDNVEETGPQTVMELVESFAESILKDNNTLSVTLETANIVLSSLHVDCNSFSRTKWPGAGVTIVDGTISLPDSALGDACVGRTGIQFAFYNSAKALGSMTSSSGLKTATGVIAARIIHNGFAQSLEGNVTYTLSLRGEQQLDSVVCAWWDTGAQNGFGDWSTEGCALLSVSNKQAHCTCKHLTNFAVLTSGVDLHTSASISKADYERISIISDVG